MAQSAEDLDNIREPEVQAGRTGAGWQIILGPAGLPKPEGIMLISKSRSILSSQKSHEVVAMIQSHFPAKEMRPRVIKPLLLGGTRLFGSTARMSFLLQVV